MTAHNLLARWSRRRTETVGAYQPVSNGNRPTHSRTRTQVTCGIGCSMRKVARVLCVADVGRMQQERREFRLVARLSQRRATNSSARASFATPARPSDSPRWGRNASRSLFAANLFTAVAANLMATDSLMMEISRLCSRLEIDALKAKALSEKSLPSSPSKTGSTLAINRQNERRNFR